MKGREAKKPTLMKAYAPFDQYQLQVERFSRAVRGEMVTIWPIEDAFLTLWVIEAVFAAARNGSAVALNDHFG